jgi:hypothetical protein
MSILHEKILITFNGYFSFFLINVKETDKIFSTKKIYCIICIIDSKKMTIIDRGTITFSF